MNRVNYCIRVVLLLVTVLLFNRLNAQEIRLKVINPKGEPQFGVYVVNPRNHYLLTSTDIEGNVLLRPTNYTLVIRYNSKAWGIKP